MWRSEVSMNKKIPKKVIDVTGIELTPGEPTVCLGNGDQGFECCCDECDYYLLCFPEYELVWTEGLDYSTVEEMILARSSSNNDHPI